MATDINLWRRLVGDQVAKLADESLQRRSWLGGSPDLYSPEEAFCQFFDDVNVEGFLLHADNGLSPQQLASYGKLVGMMSALADELPQFIEPTSLFYDPRWVEFRRHADELSRLLTEQDT